MQESNTAAATSKTSLMKEMTNNKADRLGDNDTAGGVNGDVGSPGRTLTRAPSQQAR